MAEHFKNFIRLSATAGVAIALSSPAFSQTAKIKSISFETASAYDQVIRVVSTDKKKWNKIKAGSVRFWGRMKLDTRWPGYVNRVGVVLGSCYENNCRNYPVLFAKGNVLQRDYDQARNFVLPTNKLLIPAPGVIPLVPYAGQIIKKCNQQLSTDGPTRSYSFNFPMQATFVAETLKEVGPTLTPAEVLPPGEPRFGKPDVSKTAGFMVKVVCESVIAPPAKDLTAAEPDFKVKSIQLFRSTFANAVTRPNRATVCKKARLLVRLKTSKQGPVKFKLWTKIGNQPMTSKVVDTWSNFAGPGQFKAEYTEWVSVNKTTFIQAKAEEMVNAIGMSTPWKSITLNCTGAGGGGFATQPGQNDDDQPNVVPLKVTGELVLADKAGAPKDKPRLGAAVFKLWATKPGKTSYKLTCSGGRQWTGSLATFKLGNKKYQAVGQHNFQIAKSEQIACALRSTSLANNAVVALASKKFQLVKRNPKLGGPKNLAGQSNAEQKAKKLKRLKDRAAKVKKRRQEARKSAAAKKAAELRKRKLTALKKVRAERAKAARIKAAKAKARAKRAKTQKARKQRMILRREKKSR